MIEMPLGTEVGLGILDIVLDEDPAPTPLKGHSPPIFGQCPHVYCGQTAGWINMSLGTEVNASTDVVLDGVAALP